MKIQALEAIHLEAEVHQLIEDVDTELERLKRLGEFSEDVRESLRTTFLPDRISDTLNIEGVRVNPRLTMAVLDGQAVSEFDKYSVQEILNVSAANEFIEARAISSDEPNVMFVRELQKLIEKDLISSAGSFREEEVQITGSKHTPPYSYDILDLVRDVCEQFNASNKHTLIKAVWLHVLITEIHPFLDGNGRTSRMLQDFALLSGGYLPVGVPMSERKNYYSALEKADDGSFNEIVTLIANAELVALDKAYQVAQVPDRRSAIIRRYTELAAKSTKKTEFNRYEIWRRKVDGFIKELVTWLDEFNSAGGEITFRTQTYPILSLDKWQSVREEGRASGTWLLKIDLYISGAFRVRYLLFAKRHQMNWVIDAGSNFRDEVGVFVTSVDDKEDRFSFDRYDDRYMDIRELIVAPGSMTVFSASQPQLIEGVFISTEIDRWEPSVATSNADVIERMIDGMLKKGGLI